MRVFDFLLPQQKQICASPPPLWYICHDMLNPKPPPPIRVRLCLAYFSKALSGVGTLGAKRHAVGSNCSIKEGTTRVGP